MDFSPAPTPSSPTTNEPLATPEIPALPQPTAATYRHNFFYGPFGLRAVWSLLIYFALLFAVVMSVRAVQHKIKHRHDHDTAATTKTAPAASPAAVKPDESKPEEMKPMIIGEFVLFGAFLLITWPMARIEHRRLGVYGLGGSHSVSRFFTGALWGLIAMALLIAMLHFGHLLVFDSRLDHGPAILGWGAAQLLGFLLVGLFEEYCFRGYIQYTLTRGMVSIGNLFSPAKARSIAFWIAAVITSALFYFAHTGNGGENAVGLLSVFFAGLLLIVALWRTGSLWWAIGFHMAWDWSQSFLYGVPDSGGLMQGRLFATHAIGKPLLSGGTAGPEGSLLCLPIMLLVILVLIFFTKPSPQPPLETQPQLDALNASTPPEAPPSILSPEPAS
ncbi:MAG: type II CAAX endopeptidase family protein [Acidobacteriota bacterium]